MFLKQEKPEMANLELKKNFGSKGKIFRKISVFQKNIVKKVSMDTLAKMSQNIFAYFVSENSKHFFHFRNKRTLFSGGGSPPPL